MDEPSQAEVEVKAGVGKQGLKRATVTRSTVKPLSGTGAGGRRKETRKTVANQVRACFQFGI